MEVVVASVVVAEEYLLAVSVTVPVSEAVAEAVAEAEAEEEETKSAFEIPNCTEYWNWPFESSINWMP